MATVGQTRPAPAQVKANCPSVFDRYETTLASGYEDVRVDGGLAYGSGYPGHLKDRFTPAVMLSTSKYLNILERLSDASCKTTHDIWNDNAP